MAKQARMRPSWKKWTKKSKKRAKELLATYTKDVVWIGGLPGRDAVEDTIKRLRCFERAQKKLAKLQDPDLDMVSSIINGSGIGWDENIRVRGGGAMSVLNPIETFADII